MKKAIICIIFIIYMITPTFASEYAEDIVDKLDIEKYDTIIDKSLGDNEFTFSKIVKKFVSGEFEAFSISEMIKYIIRGVFDELFVNSNIIKNVIVIALLVAFLKALTENFKSQGVSEISFYTGYMLISMLLISSFNIAINIVYETVGAVSSLIDSIMPILAGLLVICGASGSGAIFSTLILTALKFVSFFINNLFIPLMAGTVVLNIMNYITPKDVLNKLIEFLKWITNFSLKTIAISLSFVISIQKIASPMINTTVNKTVKTAITFIPVVGDIMTGAIDGVMHFVGLLKGGVMIAFLIAILICSLVPIFKLVALIILYKITAVLIEPISDKRITSCVDMLGEYTKLLLSALMIFIFIFILFVAIMLSVSG